MDALAELPVQEAGIAAYRFKVAVNIGTAERFDLAAFVGLNKIFEAPHLPASLYLGNEMFFSEK